MTRRTLVRTGIRAVVGVVVLAVGAGVVVGAQNLPLPGLTVTPAGRVVTPVALDQQRVCSGALLRLAGDAAASATTVTAVGSAATVQASGSGPSPAKTVLKGADGSGSAPFLLTAPSEGSTIPLVAGAQSQTVAQPDLSGFAAAPCVEPTNSTWLVGGSTETGRTTLINLVNPSDVNSTVDLSVWSENGAVQGPGLEGIVVGPRSQKVVPLAGFATGLTSPVVHVESRGGLIAANLQTSVVRTLEPGGVDIVTGAAPPERNVSVPGVVIAGAQAIDTKSAESGYSDLKTILRAFVPGSTNAQLAIELSSTSGTGATFSVTAEAGQVTDVPLDGLPDGQYTATIKSNVPVVAGVRSSSLSKGGQSDLAWAAGAPTLHGSLLFTAAAGQGAALSLANPTQKAIQATLTRAASKDARSAVSTISVPANSSVSTKLAAGAVETLAHADGLKAAVSYSAGGASASYALESPTAVSSPVKVYP